MASVILRFEALKNRHKFPGILPSLSATNHKVVLNSSNIFLKLEEDGSEELLEWLRCQYAELLELGLTGKKVGEKEKFSNFCK